MQLHFDLAIFTACCSARNFFRQRAQALSKRTGGVAGAADLAVCLSNGKFGTNRLLSGKTFARRDCREKERETVMSTWPEKG